MNNPCSKILMLISHLLEVIIGTLADIMHNEKSLKEKRIKTVLGEL